MVSEVCKSERGTRTYGGIEGETAFGLSSDVKIRAKYDAQIVVGCQNTGRIRRSVSCRMSKYGQNMTLGLSSDVKIRAEYDARTLVGCQNTGRIRRSDSRRMSKYGKNTTFGLSSDAKIRAKYDVRIQVENSDEHTMHKDAEQEARNCSASRNPHPRSRRPPPRAFLTQNEGSTPPPLLLRRRHRNDNTRPSFVELPQKTLIFLQVHEPTQQRTSISYRRGWGGQRDAGGANPIIFS